ncbi:MAG: T9SS type A sorting domain-containing protein, partial [Calditrichaeota bacterium]|nr:T9SS type A sorting domain-containing protein [Calditrichota bacterium]
TLLNEEKEAGIYKLNFDGRNLPSGVYFYRIQAGQFSQTRKMLLVK